MSNALKCPNPSCPFLFDPTQVPPGAVLTCPRCGMRFMLGPATAPPSVGMWGPHSNPELAGDSSLLGQARSGTSAAPGDSVATSDTQLSARRTRLVSERSPILVTVVVVAVVALACAAGFYVLKNATTASADRPANVFGVAEYNFEYEFPDPPWAKDPSPPADARANLFGLRRSDGSARATFSASKYDTHDPQPGELREPILDRLRLLFEEPDLTEHRGATWAGRPAVKYSFRGVERGSGATCAGEALAIGYKGIGYWSLAWGPEREAGALFGEFSELRSRFRLLDHRAGWAGTAQPFAIFPGEAVDYRVIDTERWWKKPSGLEPRDVDPKADLVLWAEYQFKKRSDFKPRAELAAYVLDPVGDEPVAAVKALIRDRYAKEADLFGPTKVSELSDEPQGDPPSHTEQQGIETVRLRADSQRDSNRSKLHVVAAISVSGKVVGVEARCPWADRHLWERRLIHIAGSLRPVR